MIKLKRSAPPDELTEEEQVELTSRYKENHSITVWNKPYIRKALLQSSHGKCAYCECGVGPGKKDMHIDHFKPKSLFPDEVLVWDNLLPSCPDCNRQKSNHNTSSSPIVNPYVDDPREHFYLHSYRYCAKDKSLDSKAMVTLDILGINDTTKYGLIRFQIVSQLLDKLDSIAAHAREDIDVLATDTRKKNRIYRQFRAVLEHCTPSAEFSAFAATEVLGSDTYTEIKQILKQAAAWDEELERIEREASSCVFPVVA